MSAFRVTWCLPGPVLRSAEFETFYEARDAANGEPEARHVQIATAVGGTRPRWMKIAERTLGERIG